jgi:hypothetical protein
MQLVKDELARSLVYGASANLSDVCCVRGSASKDPEEAEEFGVQHTEGGKDQGEEKKVLILVCLVMFGSLSREALRWGVPLPLSNVSRVCGVTKGGVTHSDVTDDVWESRRRPDGKDDVAPVMCMCVTRDGTTISRAGNATGFREVHKTVDDEVMTTSWTGANPGRAGELVVPVRIEGFRTRACGGSMRKGGLRKTQDMVKEDYELITREGIMRLGARNDGDPRVGGGAKLSCFT